MKIELKKYFSGKEVPRNVKFTYDKTSSKRPAWIYVKNLSKDATFLSTRINGKIYRYKIYLSATIPLFLPIDYTKKEMEKFYDEFAERYDSEVNLRNSKATKFLFSRVKPSKDSKILDLGAGSGISSLALIKSGYENLTLLDFSKGMLDKAKQKKELKNCKFIKQNISKLRIKEKYDVVVSIFSFASKDYFDDKEMPKLWRNVVSLLRPKGTLMLIGNDSKPPESLVKKSKVGKYEIVPGYNAQYYIGRKL